MTPARMGLKVKIVCFQSTVRKGGQKSMSPRPRSKVKFEGHRSRPPRSMSLSGTRSEEKVTKVKFIDQVWRSRSPRTRSKLLVGGYIRDMGWW